VREMCEFRVFLEGEEVMGDVVYARDEGNRVLLRDVLGETKVIEGARILEVNVSTTRLLLEGIR
jgi:predicted RNA-binding protein